MTPVEILVAGLSAEIVREIALRLPDVVITEVDGAAEIVEATDKDVRLVLFGESVAINELIDFARRAKTRPGGAQVAYCISMRQAENALQALTGVDIDRFFVAPLDVDEMLRELARICRVEVAPKHASHAEQIAAALVKAWERSRTDTLQRVDKLDDAAIALLENTLDGVRAGLAARDAQIIAETAARFGFEKGATVATDIADRFASTSLGAIDGVSIAEQLFALREALASPPSALPTSGLATAVSEESSAAAFDSSQIAGKRVLVVDDEPMISRGLTSLLARKGLDVTALNDPLRFWSVLDETKPSLILLDLEMPKISGTELCRVVRGDPRWSELPVIFLTGHTDSASVQRIFAAGADDYVGKPFVPAELMMRLENRLSGARARRPPVETDPLTGLATARKATDLIERFLRLARRKSDPYSIGVLHVDDFANVRATFGRTLSDAVLRGIGELLPRNLRGEDVAAWWGGSEFIVGMYGSSKENSAVKLAQICTKIGELEFLAADGKRVHIPCTAGVAEYQIDGASVVALRDEAAKALATVRDTNAPTRVGISGVNPTGSLVRRVDVAIILDDAPLVALLRHAMETRNLGVATFADGETAATALAGPAPEVRASVILLGVDLPAMNGLEVLRRLKAGEITRLSSVVMLTARAGESDILAALELGAIDHVAKPFSVPVLMHKVRTILKQGRA